MRIYVGTGNLQCSQPHHICASDQHDCGRNFLRGRVSDVWRCHLTGFQSVSNGREGGFCGASVGV